jgi:hypothetical protein
MRFVPRLICRACPNACRVDPQSFLQAHRGPCWISSRAAENAVLPGPHWVWGPSCALPVEGREEQTLKDEGTFSPGRRASVPRQSLPREECREPGAQRLDFTRRLGAMRVGVCAVTLRFQGAWEHGPDSRFRHRLARSRACDALVDHGFLITRPLCSQARLCESRSGTPDLQRNHGRFQVPRSRLAKVGERSSDARTAAGPTRLRRRVVAADRR